MREKKKKASIPTLTILGVGLVLIGLFVTAYIVKANWQKNPDAPPPEQETNYKVQCNVEVVGGFTSAGVKLGSVTCDRIGRCGVFGFGIVPLNILWQKGFVRMSDVSKTIDKKDYTRYTFTTAKVTLTGCSKYDDVKISLYDDNDNIIQSKEVRLI